MSRRRLQLFEFGKLRRTELGAQGSRELARLDDERRRRGEPAIFDWSRSGTIGARGLVGLVETPRVSLEILPKVGSDEGDAGRAAANFVYMLQVTRRVRTSVVGRASLSARQVPLLELFVRLFADELWAELSRGLHRDYSQREEECSFVRGRLLLADEMRRPPWRRHRVSVVYDEYDSDTSINRTLKAAAALLSLAGVQEATRATLGRIVDELDDVQDGVPSETEMGSIRFDRGSLRYAPLVEFARAVLAGSSPILESGSLPSFAIVLPMDVLFEEFFAESLKRHARSLELRREWIHPQAVGRRRWMLDEERSQGRFLQMRPDVVIDGPDREPSLLMDTKWKRLESGASGGLDGIASGDLYQVCSYALRYQCNEVVLVYPKVRGVGERWFRVPGSEIRIRTAFVDMERDLAREVPEFRQELSRAVRGMVGAP